jgi:hypothetical protein
MIMVDMETRAAYRVRDDLSVYARYQDAIGRILPGARPEIESLTDKAIAYVWGYQDAGGEVRDTQRSTEFGWAYGTVAAKAEWLTGGLGMRPPIQDAWKSWQEHGEIRDWQGRRIDG